MTPGISPWVVEAMEENGIGPEEFFTLPMQELRERLGAGSDVRLPDLARQEALFKARTEEEFIGKHGIKAFFISDEKYPALLRCIPDAPLMLYVLGDADLSSTPIMNVVGTRRCTSYGTNFCRKLISDLAVYFPRLTIVSGLAHGIDTAAHMSALDNHLPTLAILAHGLDMIYPAANRDLARRILSAGGALISEYPSGNKPFKKNFLSRNRIVAGISQLTFVVESEIKGGALSTANQAFSYSRDVMALPGRVSDVTSEGCNMLISKMKAQIFTSVPELMKFTGWRPEFAPNLAVEKSLFTDISEEARPIVEAMRSHTTPLSIDELHAITNLKISSLMPLLMDLEFEGVISKLPGARYELC
ncbi:MAG: DNA-processing protein DprA [Candidatus Amulumruptor caecigallinarius]|nr:DNA-processing protein DprA [Candidatus Amulumruptor caecigallinarius]